ncbi:Ger(x)C family spore germination C-terminal domain-containing protein [Sulfobacillus thermosulfidooxidans]|uniref:Ger(x)C family spore germination protein n=1 Tax=Sulfobacillus thermosulfidooxidans TaxID=28034 RepID=UPI00096BC2BA|nr:Ger(x)C family spore germination C-terminal domain-containing protein [Sulfobacillus thermosulfidooxidans]OLZ11359.1 hypothetical protein BFX05_07720 [Sulfobacillus thermosulfidooxidans]OLZ14043.1 hypothetical protein BFX06_06960 [Sulfobacillus thermosulfidooxidans]OLZ19865.1 hypothetical protein BFX07_01900 [Sulfobacillus thermosulfidooxidans]
MNKRIVSKILVVGLLALSLTGCWDSKALEHRGIVLAVGVDKTKNPGEYKWIFVFPNVTLSPSSLSNIKPNQEYYAVSVHATTFPQALMRAQEKSSRALYLGQLQTLVWSCHLSWQKLWPVINAINAEGTVPKTFWTMAAEAPLEPIVEYVSPQVVPPRTFLSAYFECRNCQPIRLRQSGWQFWSHGVSAGISPFTPLVSLTGKDFRIRHIVVYPSGGHPVIFTHQETEGFGYLTGRVQKTSITVFWNQDTVNVTTMHEHRALSIHQIGHTLDVKENIRLSGYIDEVAGHQIMQLSSQQAVITQAEHQILQACLDAIHRANATHVDPFSYAERIFWFGTHSEAFMPIHAQITVTISVKGEGILR